MLVLQGHRARMRSLSFSADGSKLASAAGQGRSVSLWDLSRGGQRTFLSRHQDKVTDVAFAPSGSLLVSLDTGGAILAWDASTAQWCRNLQPGGRYNHHAL